MEIHYHTQLKASKEFWQEQLTNKIINRTDAKVNRIDRDEALIESINCTPEHDIINLSKQYPDHTFEAKYNAEDPYENLATTYQYLNGERKFVKEEYEYCFTSQFTDWNKLDPKVYAKFKRRVAKYFSDAENYRIRTSENDPTFEDQPIDIDYNDEDVLFCPAVEYIDGEVILTAKKLGLTYFDVTVKFKNKKIAQGNTVDKISAEDYNDVPFKK